MRGIIHKSLIPLCFCVIMFVSTLPATAYNLRKISSREGLSNSSVCCLLQDNQRFLWLGTYDGLNMYDGREIHTYKPDINNPNSLSGNVIRNIVETENNYLWISTKWGLNKLSKRNNSIEGFYQEFKDDSYSVKDSKEHLIILGKTGVLSVYNQYTNAFIDLPINPEITCERVNTVTIDSKDVIWINHQGVLERYVLTFEDEQNPQITRIPDYEHPYKANHIFSNTRTLLMIDVKGNLHSILPTGSIFICNIQSLIQENGLISCAIYDGEDVLISFKTNGVFRLSSANSYKAEKLDINCGVFVIKKDEAQDIIWIGTDGQGVYALTKDDYTFNNLNLVQIPLIKQRPIRAIYTDKQNNLWLGTKDNGVIQIQNYDQAPFYSSENVIHFSTENGLSNNEVFALARNHPHDVLWIGSNGPGLNYYSYKDKKVHTLRNRTGEEISDVHALLDMQDSLLWVGAGNSLLKIRIGKAENQLEAENSKRFSFNVKNKQRLNQIYAIHQENDSILWLGIRGNGLVRFNCINEHYDFIFFEEQGIAPMNDILCILQDKNKTFWLGSSYGITKFIMHPNGTYSYKNYNENNGLPNNTIHGILESHDGKLWLSSNAGISLFDPVKETFRNFNQKTGLQIIEFSDNAYFKDNERSSYFFGGVDGLVWMEDERNEAKTAFIPQIYFTRLRIFNKEYNIGEFQKAKDDKYFIELSHKQNFFAISFVASDFINGENSQYSYKLDNFSNVWMDTPMNEAQFTNIPPGSYTLRVKYNDGTGQNDNHEQSILIVILPPWYLTFYAKILYGLLIAGTILLTIHFSKKKYERKKAKIAKQLQEKYKEEMYEEKLRFFTNITHEFSTPLTLIYGPCDRILSYQQSDSYIRRYIQVIKSNAERLNALIQEIIDFRRMETGNKVCRIETLNVSRITKEITDSFAELSEQNNINFQVEITDNIIWNTDSSCYSKILNNLISNAFKYTPAHGSITISVNVVNDILTLTVYNTGKGIEQEDIPFIFNRYSVLDNIKENNIKGLSSRNGLGLAICHSMTQLLQGQIEVTSKVNEYARFVVTLPLLQTDEKTPTRDIAEASPAKETDDGTEKEKELILIIDDNEEVLWMLKDILAADYKIAMAKDGQTGLEILKKETPHLIITDIMMPQMDGITLTRLIKENKHTMHIPLIILSAKHSNEEKIEGINSGADIYISKPFNTDYLKSIIRQQLRKRRNMEQYYNSSASAFEFTNGQLLKKEDKEFLQTIIDVIDRNIDNSDFAPEELANSMQISIRKLYRKLKELEQLPPNDFIKEQRIRYAARLIVTTTLTIQEIMYKSGFTNHSHFYKAFAKRFNQTPKEYRETNKA